MNTRLIVAIAATLLAGAASAQTYPSKPIRVIPGQPGGGGYVQMLAMKDLLSMRLGQPIVMDARAASLMGGLLARSQPDGYTLMVAGNTVWYQPLLEKTDYDTLKDFTAITSMGASPNILVVNPSLPVNSVKELIAYARAKPGVLNYSSAATGSSYHIAAELFKSMTRTDIVRVNYTGAGPTIQAVLSGEVQMSFGTSASVAQLMKAGKLRALAHTFLKPTALAPDLPPMADTLPGFEVTSLNVLFAPVKTPDNIVRRLQQEFVAVMALDSIKEQFLAAGAEPLFTTPEQAAAEVRTQYAALAKLIKDAGITGGN